MCGRHTWPQSTPFEGDASVSLDQHSKSMDSDGWLSSGRDREKRVLPRSRHLAPQVSGLYSFSSLTIWLSLSGIQALVWLRRFRRLRVSSGMISTERFNSSEFLGVFDFSSKIQKSWPWPTV
jgi:hypothetical protein